MAQKAGRKPALPCGAIAQPALRLYLFWACLGKYAIEKEVCFMRNPNGYGSVTKLSGNRRRPYIVKKTVGWNEKGHPIYDIIGYAETREEGNILLAAYNRDPWDVNQAKITLEELFNLWKEKKLPKLGKSNQAALRSAFKHCVALKEVPYKLIRSYQMQETIDACGKGYST